MTKHQEKELDILYQTHLLKVWGYKSILGGEANMIHHMVQGKHKSIRWYVPCGVPLTIKQHNEIHANKWAEYKEMIINIKGQEWHNDIERQKYKLAKYLDYNKVKAHILGETENYV